MTIKNQTTTIKKRLIWLVSMFSVILIAVSGFELIEEFKSLGFIDNNESTIKKTFGYLCLSLLAYTAIKCHLEWNKKLKDD